MNDKTLTVGQLLDKLAKFDRSRPVWLAVDPGTYSNIIYEPVECVFDATDLQARTCELAGFPANAVMLEMS